MQITRLHVSGFVCIREHFVLDSNLYVSMHVSVFRASTSIRENDENTLDLRREESGCSILYDEPTLMGLAIVCCHLTHVFYFVFCLEAALSKQACRIRSHPGILTSQYLIECRR